MGKFCKIGQGLLGFIEPGTEHLEVVPIALVLNQLHPAACLMCELPEVQGIIQQDLVTAHLHQCGRQALELLGSAVVFGWRRG